MTLSIELRVRIVEAYENGFGTYEEIAEIFGCGEATVSRLLRRSRETGSVAPSPHGGGRELKIDSYGLKLLRRWLEEKSDCTLEELTQRYNGCKSTKNVSRATVGRAVNCRLRLPRKKRLIEQRKETGRMFVRRESSSLSLFKK